MIYNPGINQKLIKLLECNEESDETEDFSALYTPLLPLNTKKA